MRIFAKNPKIDSNDLILARKKQQDLEITKAITREGGVSKGIQVHKKKRMMEETYEKQMSKAPVHLDEAMQTQILEGRAIQNAKNRGYTILPSWMINLLHFDGKERGGGGGEKGAQYSRFNTRSLKYDY